MARGRAVGTLSSPVDEKPPLTLNQYEAELDRWSSALASIQDHPQQIQHLRESVPAEWVVESAGAHFEVRTRWLVRSLYDMERNHKSIPKRTSEVEAHLAMLRRGARQFAAPPTGPTPASAREQIDRILKQREFAGMEGPTAFDRLLRRIEEWLANLLAKIFGRARISRSMGNAFAWAAIVLAFLLIAVWVVRYLARRSRQGALELGGARFTPANSRQWLKDAVASAQAGEYREAIHCAYWAGIARMEEVGALPEDRSRTPRESLRLLEPRSDRRDPLMRLTQRFELIWYGHRPASAADWNDAVAQLERMGCPLQSTPAIAAS